jgi:Pyridoxamine 5'-phosphate oxidase
VRPNARPHVTTIAAVWLDGAVHFTTGERERKAKNLARNPYCIVTTGYRGLEGLDLVVEGKATRVATAPALRGLAEAYRRKYGRLFRYEVRDGALYHQDTVDRVLAYRVRARKALGFGKGGRFSQTRWRLLGTPVQPRPSRSRRC